MSRCIVIDMKKQPPPEKPKPEEYPACARPQGLKPTLKTTLGEAVGLLRIGNKIIVGGVAVGVVDGEDDT